MITREEAKDVGIGISMVPRSKIEDAIDFLIDNLYNGFDKQLKANQDQIRKAQNIISEERIKNDKITDAVSRAGFELKEIKEEYVLCKI